MPNLLSDSRPEVGPSASRWTHRLRSWRIELSKLVPAAGDGRGVRSSGRGRAESWVVRVGRFYVCTGERDQVWMTLSALSQLNPTKRSAPDCPLQPIHRCIKPALIDLQR
jgi:hypothetical protein